MAKCRGCGDDTRDYNSPGLGWMHWPCEVERLTELWEEADGLYADLTERDTRIRELEAKLEAYERQPADYASRPVSHIDMLSHEQAQDELRYACGALDVAERRERELEAEVERLRADERRLDWFAGQHDGSDGLAGCVHAITVRPFQHVREAMDAALAAGEKGEPE